MTTEKDIVTKECIALDYKNTHFNVIKLIAAVFVMVAFMVFYFIASFLNSNLESRIIPGIFYTIAILFVAVYVLIFLYHIRNYIMLQKGNYRIEVDHLKESRRIRGNILGAGYRPAWFRFNQYGQYNFSEFDYYKWSECFSTHANGLLERFQVGDPFYLVIIDKKTIAMIYSTKDFAVEGTDKT